MAEKNIPLLKRLRTRFLRMRHRKHFNMDDVVQVTECGAAMCIAGHALDLEGYKFKKDQYGDFNWFTPDGLKVVDPLLAARELLGLSSEEAMHEDYHDVIRKNGLFFRFDLKTPKQAAKVIERLISDNVPAR
jgi:uncharacterized protein YodC (DUF2158 family)